MIHVYINANCVSFKLSIITSQPVVQVYTVCMQLTVTKSFKRMSINV